MATAVAAPPMPPAPIAPVLPGAPPTALGGVRVCAAGTLRFTLDRHDKPIRLGHGGNRGSCVYAVECGGERLAFKQCPMQACELDLCAALQRRVFGAAATEEADASDAGAAVPGLVHPIALATQESFIVDKAVNGEVFAGLGSNFVGIVMPRYDFTLHKLLASNAAKKPSASRNPRASPLPWGTASNASSVAPFVPPMALPAGTSAESVGGDSGFPTSPRPQALNRGDGEDEEPPETPVAEEHDFSPQELQPPVFSERRRLGRIDDPSVVVCIIMQVLDGLVAMRELPHSSRRTFAAFGDAEFDGFAHQDLRLDNILVTRAGAVALCDFELVGHVAGKSVVTNIDHDAPRLLPLAYHPPEGVNGPKGDVWLLGLLTLDLLTGVTPLIDPAVAFDDFGDGPLLVVDPDLGMDWRFIRAHVTTKLRALDPAAAKDRFLPAEAAALVQGLDEFCAACMTNDPDLRPDVAELRRHPVFEQYAAAAGPDPRLPLKRWLVAAQCPSTPATTPNAGRPPSQM